LTQTNVLGKGDFVVPRQTYWEQETCLDGCNERLVEHCMGRMCPEAARLYGTDVPRSNCNQLVKHRTGRMCLEAMRLYGTDVPGSNSNDKVVRDGCAWSNHNCFDFWSDTGLISPGMTFPSDWSLGIDTLIIVSDHLIPWPGSVDPSTCAGKRGHLERMCRGSGEATKRNSFCVSFHGFEACLHCWIELLASWRRRGRKCLLIRVTVPMSLRYDLNWIS
jgi:hypothetical protein